MAFLNSLITKQLMLQPISMTEPKVSFIPMNLTDKHNPECSRMLKYNTYEFVL
jgi:hypothetical protein